MNDRPKKIFIGYALSGREKEAVDELRGRIATGFGARGALTSPPHITLFYPFETTDPAPLARELGRLSRSLVPFTVPVTGFEAFEQAVWFLEPAQDPALFSLKEKVALIVKDTIGIKENETRRDPHFHITLAYKDVSPETHRRIAEFLRRETLPIENVVIDNITLFGRRADDSGWEPMEVFSFSGAPGTSEQDRS